MKCADCGHAATTSRHVGTGQSLTVPGLWTRRYRTLCDRCSSLYDRDAADRRADRHDEWRAR